MVIRLLLLFAQYGHLTALPNDKQCDESVLIQASKSCTTDCWGKTNQWTCFEDCARSAKERAVNCGKLQVTIENNHATVTTTSHKKGHPASHAFDKDQATFWHSDPRSKPTAMTIEFDSVQFVKEIVLVKRVGFPNRYQNVCISLGVSFYCFTLLKLIIFISP